MSVIRIASRYAKSLMDLAIEQDKLERIKEDILSFKNATENRDFYLLLKSPIVNGDKKRQIFDALFEGKYDELTSAFLRLLLTKGRESYLPEVADEFMHQYQERKRISTIKVTTAQAISAEALEKIKGKLLLSKETLDQIEVETAINPDLIGGFIIEFGDKLYDSSVAHKLEKLKKEFSGNSYVKNF